MQMTDCDLLFYAVASCLMYQHRDVKVTEQKLNKNFPNLCHWFVDKKLSFHFRQDETKSIHKKQSKKDSNLDIRYATICIK